MLLVVRLVVADTIHMLCLSRSFEEGLLGAYFEPSDERV